MCLKLVIFLKLLQQTKPVRLLSYSLHCHLPSMVFFLPFLDLCIILSLFFILLAPFTLHCLCHGSLQKYFNCHVPATIAASVGISVAIIVTVSTMPTIQAIGYHVKSTREHDHSKSAERNIGDQEYCNYPLLHFNGICKSLCKTSCSHLAPYALTPLKCM